MLNEQSAAPDDGAPLTITVSLTNESRQLLEQLAADEGWTLDETAAAVLEGSLSGEPEAGSGDTPDQTEAARLRSQIGAHSAGLRIPSTSS
jgi:hypothetical protein